jgi:hypothetical protein
MIVKSKEIIEREVIWEKRAAGNGGRGFLIRNYLQDMNVRRKVMSEY